METKLELYQRNKAIPFSLLQGSTAAFPAGTASRRACSHVPGHATLMQLSPQSHGSCMWGQPPLGLPASSGSTGPLWVCQPPLGLPAPSHFPGKNGERAGCCLTRRKASQNSCSERMQEFKRQLPPLPPSSTDLDVLGEALIHRLRSKPCAEHPTVVVETGISWVQCSFSCSPAAGKRINSQIRVLRRRKHEQRSS